MYARCAFCTRCRKKLQKRAQEACRAPGSASPPPRPRSLPCAVHTSARVQSTLDTHAPRVRASPAMQMLSCGNTRSRQKLGCRARVTGHWLPVGRLAAGTSGANALYKHARHLRCAPPCIADMLCMPLTSTVARCHRTQSLDVNDRVEDVRHDEDDRGHDGRCERVRAHSHLRLLRPKSHTPARCQAPLTLLSKQDPFQHPDGHGRPSLLTPLLFSDARLLLARRTNLVLRVVMSRLLKARATARLLATARVLPWIFHSSSDNPSQIRISSMQAEGELL